MDITTETLQTFLDDAWDAAPASANTLRDQLRTFEKAATNLFRAGSIVSVSKNSASQTYRGPGLGSYTPVQISNAWRQLINLHDTTKTSIQGELGAGAPEDLDSLVYARMMGSLVVVTEYQTDITDLLLPPTLPSPTLTQ